VTLCLAQMPAAPGGAKAGRWRCVVALVKCNVLHLRSWVL